VGKARSVSVGNLIMVVHHSRIARLDVPARVIFGSPAFFEREALAKRLSNIKHEVSFSKSRSLDSLETKFETVWQCWLIKLCKDLIDISKRKRILGLGPVFGLKTSVSISYCSVHHGYKLTNCNNAGNVPLGLLGRQQTVLVSVTSLQH